MACSKQLGGRRLELLLHGKQSGQLDVSRMKFDLDASVLEHLDFDEAEVSNRKRGGIVIGIQIAERSEKFRAVGRHPATI